MSKPQIIQQLEKKQLKKDLPRFGVGDTIRVHTRIIEGKRERIQIFQGTVIARSGSGASETMTLHRVAYGEGMERVFLIHSPRIAKIELVIEGHVKRSKLYHLCGTSGKKAKVKGRITSRHRKFAEEDQLKAQEEHQEEAVESEAVNEADAAETESSAE